ncbi:protoporphyrinogen oxidase [Adelges cooleyi]|uniref:protoporphyrinogen oxidase n=1 Tax=Adelges cooleyi TaxID=133065 RepID=UPI00217F2EE4|nr:protoporphyrinogen oxidase [Adelges cooleyi]
MPTGTIGILGGGLGGLSAAYYLKRDKPDQPVSLVDSNDYAGGWIRSWADKDSGVVTELGPRTIRGRGETANNTFGLIKELDIDDLVRTVGPDASARYIYAKGDTHVLPSGALRALFAVNTPFTRPLGYYVLRECFLTNGGAEVCADDDHEEESAYDFFHRRFGPEMADYLISPLMCGICGGDAKTISVKFMFRHLYEAERKHGSVAVGLLKETLAGRKKRGKDVDGQSGLTAAQPPPVYYLDGGLQRLTRILHLRAESLGASVQLNTECVELHLCNKGGGATAVLSNGKTLECEHVVSTIPARRLAEVLVGHDGLAKLLSSVPTATIATTNLSYDDPDALAPYKGFGVLAAPSEGLSLLGITFDNCVYGRRDRVDLTVMMGGHAFDKHFGGDPALTSEESLTVTAVDHVRRVLGVRALPDRYGSRVLYDCIPQYTVGHYGRVTQMKDYIFQNRLPLTLAGSSYAGVSINDVIFASLKAAKRLLRKS